MAIVIDDLQVEPATPQPQKKRGGDDAGGGGGGKPPDPEELERIHRAQAERNERVWAH